MAVQLDHTFSLRLDEEDRERLALLQRQTGLSAGEVLRVLLRRGVDALKAAPKQNLHVARAALEGRPGVSLACPAYFRELIFEAQQGGSRDGYRKAGYEFARRIFETYDGGDATALALLARVARRRGLLGAHTLTNAEHVFEWARRYLPRCVELVPRKRVHSFKKGIEAALDERVVRR
jgi:hypothetical protein